MKKKLKCWQKMTIIGGLLLSAFGTSRAYVAYRNNQWKEILDDTSLSYFGVDSSLYAGSDENIFNLDMQSEDTKYLVVLGARDDQETNEMILGLVEDSGGITQPIVQSNDVCGLTRYLNQDFLMERNNNVVISSGSMFSSDSLDEVVKSNVDAEEIGVIFGISSYDMEKNDLDEESIVNLTVIRTDELKSSYSPKACEKIWEKMDVLYKEGKRIGVEDPMAYMTEGIRPFFEYYKREIDRIDNLPEDEIYHIGSNEYVIIAKDHSSVFETDALSEMEFVLNNHSDFICRMLEGGYKLQGAHVATCSRHIESFSIEGDVWFEFDSSFQIGSYQDAGIIRFDGTYGLLYGSD